MGIFVIEANLRPLLILLELFVQPVRFDRLIFFFDDALPCILIFPIPFIGTGFLRQGGRSHEKWQNGQGR